MVKRQVDGASLNRGIINDMSVCCCMPIVNLELRGEMRKRCGKKQGRYVLVYCESHAAQKVIQAERLKWNVNCSRYQPDPQALTLTSLLQVRLKNCP